MSAITANTSGAMLPMDTQTPPPSGKVQKKKRSVPYVPMYKPSDEGQSLQGIDEECAPGPNAARKVVQLMTPSGLKDVIVLADDIPTRSRADYLLRQEAPETCNVWTEPEVMTVNESIKPTFSSRVLYFMNLFYNFHSHVIVRLVAKPPLFSAQRFWVTTDPDSDGENYDSVGFDWNPSLENEIYVLMPWVDFTHMRPVDTILDDTFTGLGTFRVIPVTNLVYESGAPTTLDVAYMCCPYTLTLFDPRAVDKPTRSVKGVEQGFNHEVDWVSELNRLFQAIGIPGPVFFEFVQVNLVWKALYNFRLGPITLGGEGSGKTKRDAKLEGCKDFIRRIDIHMRNVSPQLKIAYPNWYDIRKAFADMRNRLRMIEQIQNGTPVPHWTALSAHRYVNPDDLYPHRVQGTEQIFEYEYNELSTIPEEDYGVSEDSSERVTSHWQYLQSETVTAATDSFTLQVDLTKISTSTMEAKRHLKFSRMPLFKVNTTSNPTTTALYRVTCHPRLNVANTFQLPGVEWDIKKGDFIISPYWIDILSAVEPADRKIDLRFTRIVGSHGTDFEVTLWMNTHPLNYHHMVDPNVIHKRIQGTEQMETFPDQESDNSTPSDNSIQETEDVNKVTSASHNVVQVEQVGPTLSERDWKFVTNAKLDTEKYSAQSMAVTPLLFGKYNFWNARRYRKWKGTLRVKVQSTSASTTNGQIFLRHSDEPLPDVVENPQDLVKMYPCAKGSYNEGAIELDLKWRCPTPTAACDAVKYSKQPEGRNGYLDIVYVQATNKITPTADNDVQIAIYADVSDITYSHPSAQVSTLQWAPPNIIAHLRDATPLRVGPTSEIVTASASTGYVFKNASGNTVSFLPKQVLYVQSENPEWNMNDEYGNSILNYTNDKLQLPLIETITAADSEMTVAIQVIGTGNSTMSTIPSNVDKVFTAPPLMYAHHTEGGLYITNCSVTPCEYPIRQWIDEHLDTLNNHIDSDRIDLR
ncbi:hypothetical protein 2 [Wenling crustacean virus 6]|uniref:hypothetical protein 2 n=1 Tax=Wenling crustacean virus 6 TaxID=1923489 RepID=UPI000909B0B7|nr:hypothetical protein 2 [Wenling crustacean virus 6]APG78479.1 hypothetical protein 2 [Wenling crustacean virus 6]